MALPEAPNSATCKIKSPAGYSWLFTMRTEKTVDLVKQMLAMESQFKEYEWMPDSYTAPKGSDSKPSTEKCEECGGPATFREGVSKAGKPYKGIFCNNKECGHAKWIR